MCLGSVWRRCRLRRWRRARRPAQAKYPERPIRLVIPFPPGGVNDAIGRPWADKMKPLLGTVVVENMGGAGGAVGRARGRARAARRLYASRRLGRNPGDHPDCQQPAAVRSGQGVRDDLAPRHHGGVHRGASVGAGADAAAAHRLCQGQSRQAILWLGRLWHHEASRRQLFKSLGTPDIVHIPVSRAQGRR